VSAVCAAVRTAKPHTAVLLSLISFTGAVYSPNFLSPAFRGAWLATVLGIGGETASLMNAALAMLVVALLWFATAVLNDCYDIDVDRVSNPSRAIVSGVLKREHALRLSSVLYAIAVILSTALGAYAVIVAVFLTLLGMQYSAPPLRLRKNGIAGMSVIGVGVSLVFIFGSVSQHHLSSETFELAAIFGFFAFNISLIKDFKDTEGDKRAGIATLPVVLGYERAAALAMPMIAVSYLLLIATVHHMQAMAVLTLAAVTNVVAVHGLRTRMVRPGAAYAVTRLCGALVILCFILLRFEPPA